MTPTPFTILIERARNIRVEDEIERRGIKLRGRGADRCGACPRCGGDDRFSIHTKKQVFNCRGFGGGDVIALVRHLDDCDVTDAVYTLTGEAKPNGGSNGLARAIAAKKKAKQPKLAVVPPTTEEALKETVAKKVIAATFDGYTDENGVVIYAVDRLEYQNADGSYVLKADGKRKKSFLQRRPDPDRPGAWLYNLDGITRVLYRLPELIEAVAAGRLVYIVEGEACAEALREIGITTTTNAGGAGKWESGCPDEYSRGAEVVHDPCNDVGAGQKHIVDIAGFSRRRRRAYSGRHAAQLAGEGRHQGLVGRRPYT